MLRETHSVDSVVIHDSVFIRKAGDTVYQLRWRTCWRDRVIHDTVVERLTDTIRETETVEKTVEVPKKGGNAGWIVAMTLFSIIIIYLFLKTR